MDPVTVLVVEDLEDLRDLLRRLLLSRGYQVICADSAEEALRQAALAPIDVLLTDWQLPGMNGRDLAQRLRASHPQLKVLLTSGQMQVKDQDLAWLEGLGAYLTKPYDFDVMFEALARLSAKAA